MVGEHGFPDAKAFVLQVFGLDARHQQVAAVATIVQFDAGSLAGHFQFVFGNQGDLATVQELPMTVVVVVAVALQAAVVYGGDRVNGLHGLPGPARDVDSFEGWCGFGAKPGFQPVEKHRMSIPGEHQFRKNWGKTQNFASMSPTIFSW